MNAFTVVMSEITMAGYGYRVETDFAKVRREIESAGKELTPFFWTNYYDFNGKNAFCVVLEKDGQGLAYLCSQKMDLGARSLETAYIQRLEAIYSHDSAAKLDPTWTCEPLRDITGPIAYSGDAVTHGDLRTLGNSKRYLAAISKLSLYLTLSTWSDVNWIVGTIRERDMSRGLGWLYGAARCYPMAERWLTLPEKRLANYAVLASSRQDVLWSAKTVLAMHQSEQQARTIETSAAEALLPRPETDG